MRWGQVKTYLSLRLKVALSVLAHNLKYIDLELGRLGCTIHDRTSVA